MTGPSFVALDFECANGSHASICSIGVVRVTDGVIEQPRHWFVRPHRDYRYLAGMNRQITGLDPRDIARAKGFDYWGPHLARNIGNSVLVGHNIKADLSMFEQSWHSHRLGPSPAFRFLDTAPLARLHRPGLERYKLNVVYEAVMGKPMANHHRSDADAVAAAEVALVLLGESRHSIDQLARWRPGKQYMDLKPAPERRAWSYDC